MVSKHHETGEAMPDDLIDKIVRSDAINKGEMQAEVAGIRLTHVK